MLKERLNNLYISRRTLWNMAVFQFKAKYAGSALGIWWAVFSPLILAVSINFVFTAGFKIKIPNFTLFALSGIIPWNFFAAALLEATNSFIANSSVLKQSIFPREFIPMSTVLGNLLNFFVGFIFLLPLFIIFNLGLINLLLFLLIIIMIHFIFVMGLGLLFSTLNVFFRDLLHFLNVGMMIWFWVTPVFYSFEMLPLRFHWICLLNPMTHYVILYQNILFKSIRPSLSELFTAFLISLAFFFIGYYFFFKKETQLLKKI